MPQWWSKYPLYLGDGGDSESVQRLHARMVQFNYGADPGWGPYGQFSSALGARSMFSDVKQAGARVITWLEAFGTCFIYAAAFHRREDGSFALDKHRLSDNEEPLPKMVYSAWNWGDAKNEEANAFYWIGPHNIVNDEEFVPGFLRQEQLEFPIPSYPDGRLAVGWLPGRKYPLNARIYDAVCSKDINGEPDIAGEGLRSCSQGSADGLLTLQVDENLSTYFKDCQPGDTAHIATMGLGKDPAAPFWTDYFRIIIRQQLQLGLDGVWCDNYGPFNNFGFNPIQNGFGEWAVHRFRDFLRQSMSPISRKELGLEDLSTFDIRTYLKQKAVEFGAQQAENIWDEAWRDSRWLNEPLWNAFKVFKQQMGQEGLKSFYAVAKEEAARSGRDDFCIMGNDIPGTLGWTQGEYLDMTSAEINPSWSMIGGSRGIMLPPQGKMAVVYRAALAHQKGPYATFWYYLGGENQQHQQKPELSKVLMAEAFANSTFLKYGKNPVLPGTDDSVAWWNGFLDQNEDAFGRRQPMADVGILYSPDNQLASVPPGHFVYNHDRQPHTFGHWGFATALLDAHVPYDVVTDWNVSLASLQRFSTFIIPDAECVPDSLLPILKQWVGCGGRLILTGAFGVRHGAAKFFAKREHPLLAELLDQPVTVTPALAEQPRGDVLIMVADATDIRKVGEEKDSHLVPPPQQSKISDDEAVHVQKLGNGTIVWTAAPVGMTYYLEANQRTSYLDRIQELVGPSNIFDGQALPETVGAFCWHKEENALFVDLVNYDLNLEADTLKPARNLRFKVKLPHGAETVTATTLSPDAACNLVVCEEDGWAVVQLETLQHFTSVKLCW